MSLRIRRGTNSQRTGITFDLGEIVYTTDTQKLYIGDGVTAGGKNLLETSAGVGFTFNPTTQQIDFSIGNLNLNTAQVSEDASRLYYTNERAQDTVGAALIAGNAFNTGVTFTYDDVNNRITAVSTGGLTNISADTNPSLGGNLSTGSFSISGNGSVTTGTITATNLGGNLSTGAFNISGTGSITAGALNSSIVKSTVYQGLTQANDIILHSTSNSAVNVVTITDGGGNNPTVNLNTSRGTIASPTTNIAGDILGGYQVKGYGSGGYTIAVAMLARWSLGTVNFTSAYPASQLLLAVGANSSSPTLATFDGLTGVFTAPALATTVYSATGTSIPSAVTSGVGARAFVSDATAATFDTAYTSGGSNKVPVYSDGTTWKIG